MKVIKMRLTGVEARNEGAMILWLRRMCEGKGLVAEISETNDEEDEISATLWDTNNDSDININSQLVSLGLAVNTK